MPPGEILDEFGNPVRGSNSGGTILDENGNPMGGGNVNPPNNANWWDRLSTFGSGLMDFGATAAESGFGNPVAMGMNFGQNPQRTIDAGRSMIDSLFIHPAKTLWEGARSSDPNAFTRSLVQTAGMDPAAIKEDWNEGDYAALAADIGPQAALGYLTHKMMGGKKPTMEVLPPEAKIIGDQKLLQGKTYAKPDISYGQKQLGPYNEPIPEVTGIETYEGPRQIAGTAPERLQLPAVGETVDNRSPSFISGERGLVDTNLDYPIDMADPAKLRGNPITPEDIVEIARIRPDLDTPTIMRMLEEKGTLLDSEMGQLGSLNPIDVAAGTTGRNIAEGFSGDLAQADPVFGALVPDRLKAPNESIMPTENSLGMRGPQVAAPILEQPLGGRVVNPPRVEPPYNPNLVDVINRSLKPDELPTPVKPPYDPNRMDVVNRTLAPEAPRVPKEFPKVYAPDAKLELTRTDFDSPEIQHQLRDVGKDMNPAVRKGGVSSVPEIKAAAAQVLATRPGFIRSAYDYLGTSGWSILDNMGEGGKSLSRFMRLTRAEGAKEAGTLISKHRAPIDKLNNADFAKAVDHLEAGTVSPNGKIKAAVDAMKAMLDESGQFAENSGMVMANPSGQLTKFQRMANNYFPRKWMPGTFNEGSLVNELVKKGMSPTQAKFVVENGIKSGPRLISPQHMRSMNLPGYLKTKGALFEHVNDIMERSMEAQRYGPTDLGNKNSPLMEMIRQTADPEKAESIVRDQLGRVKRDPNLERVAAGVNSFEALVKLPLFAISNMNQAAAIGFRNNLKNTVGGLVETLKNVRSAEDTGALQVTATNILKETGQNAVIRGASKVFGWEKSETFLRSWAANAGKMQAETLFKKLKQNPADMTARAQLDDLLLTDVDKVLKQDKLTPEQVKVAGFRTSELTQGLVDAADLPPMWSANPLMRIPLMLKRFAFQQNRILKDSFKAVKTPQERIVLAGKMLGLYTLTGETTKDVKTAIADLIAGRDPIEGFTERGGSALGRVLDDLNGAYALGLIGSLTEEMAGGNVERFLKTLAGPAISDLAEVGAGIGRSVQSGDIAPAGREVIKAGMPMGYAVAPQVFPPQ